MISNALGLLFGIIIIAAVVPLVFIQFGGLRESVDGMCVVRHVNIDVADGPAVAPSSDFSYYPPDGTTWSIGQSWQTGGPFNVASVPAGLNDTDSGAGLLNPGPTTCNESMPQVIILNADNTAAFPTSNLPLHSEFIYNYVPTDLTGNQYTGILTTLLDLMPVAVIVGVFGLVGTFAWKKLGGRKSGVPGM